MKKQRNLERVDQRTRDCQQLLEAANGILIM